MSGRLSGKVCVITGTGGSVGRAAALAFAREGASVSRYVRFIIGNPLIMKEMAKHVPDAGSYAPVTALVDERADGVHLSYDRMVSFLGPYGNAAALNVARNLDSKVEKILQQAAA